MKRLYEQISIETWKKIAARVQNLNISTGSSAEFKFNLKALQKLLSDLDLYLEIGSNKPEYKGQIGLASLLNSVYNTSITLQNSIREFCEYIYILDDLGVESIEYKPINFPNKINTKLEYEDDYLHLQKVINKCYTDGKFKLSRPDIISYRDYYRYLITDIKDASYLLTTKISHQRPYAYKEPQVLESSVVIKNFNGNLPDKKELLNTEFPKLKIHSRKISWDESPEYSQIFKEYNPEELENVKRLKK